MEGRSVTRIAGWDTHGLPVEIEAEKKLGISGKPEIEALGIAEFNKVCKDSVFTYKEEWEQLSERIGYWLEYWRPYVTFHATYIESVWAILKEFADKGLLYRGHKSVPYCPRCGTALSSHEVAQGYRDVEDPSLTFVAEILTEDGRPDPDGRAFLAWTTTPWTVPSQRRPRGSPRAHLRRGSARRSPLHRGAGPGRAPLRRRRRGRCGARWCRPRGVALPASPRDRGSSGRSGQRLDRGGRGLRQRGRWNGGSCIWPPRSAPTTTRPDSVTTPSDAEPDRRVRSLRGGRRARRRQVRKGRRPVASRRARQATSALRYRAGHAQLSALLALRIATPVRRFGLVVRGHVHAQG